MFVQMVRACATVFILIGDSGQQDLYIYRDIARSYPDRILAIYIRDLALSKTAKRIKNELENSMETDVEVALIKNAEEAAQHAAAKGFIFSEALPEIEKDKKQDEGVLPGKVEA
ncbi:MAG: DUF2183 domain-containing protein [Pedobacter sp.]|nr:MAG: DUF2183 domain-containing protein [Pedobacter sp.]